MLYMLHTHAVVEVDKVLHARHSNEGGIQMQRELHTELGAPWQHEADVAGEWYAGAILCVRKQCSLVEQRTPNYVEHQRV